MYKKDRLSDERLVLLHQKKRLNAFFTIYNRYQNYGYAIIYHTLGKYKLINSLKEEKDAILYDSIMEGLATFDLKRGTFRNLLSTIITNLTLNYIREFQKDPLSDYISLDANIEEGNNLIFADSGTFADKNELPNEIIDANRHAEKLMANYTGIHKRKIREMIRLKESGYTYEEIAAKLKMSTKAVDAIFYRIKKRIDVKNNNKIKK